MTQITYFSIGATLNTYDATAFNYINAEKDNILFAADKIGLPISTAIAGAMAEERSGLDLYQNLASDLIARYNIPFQDFTPFFTSGGNWSVLYSALNANVTNYSLRTNQNWIDDYNDLNANPIDVTNLSTLEKYIQKFQHPALNDFGLANFNMKTAIHLINDTDINLLTTLGLDGYRNNYPQLAADISDDNLGLTAKLYGLMIKEADTWFTTKNAYGSDWARLPQEIKDALYITYVNLGHDKMEQRSRLG